MEGGRGRYPARLQPGARVSRGALLLVRDQLQPGRARRSRRSRPLPRPPSPRVLPGSRPRAPPPGGLRGGAEGGGLRRSHRRPLRCADGDHGRAGPQAGEPRRRPPLAPGPLVSRTRTRVAGPPPHEARPATAALVRVLAGPGRAGPGLAGLGRAARAESAGGAPRRTARRRPRPPSCRCVGPGFAGPPGGSRRSAPGIRPGGCGEGLRRAETGASRASSPAGRTARWGRAQLPSLDLGHSGALSARLGGCPGPGSLDFKWSLSGAGAVYPATGGAGAAFDGLNFYPPWLGTRGGWVLN